MRTTASILRAFDESLSIEEAEIPPLAPGQILVQVEATGVCGSDVHMWRGRDPRLPLEQATVALETARDRQAMKAVPGARPKSTL